MDVDDDERSTCTSEAEEGSCHTQFYSNSGGSIDSRNSDFEIDEVLDTRRVPSVVGSDCSIDIGNECDDVSETLERGCRICHLSFQVHGSDVESGITIELGCSCRNDLAAAHQHCAETWFKIKGNRICEICNAIARNVVVPSDIVSTQQIAELSTYSTNADPVPAASTSATNSPSTSETLTFFIGHQLVNILLSCVVSVFFLSWLFHFHMPF
ncbi:hypothetical protein DCAR_0313776 [Daucus carota subsp. sativus]|uniref:RING-CH-type domain-containing protein n=1 Tax=Daucus carota subsp. sativus TaxID=79200 RepID=A0AAF0WUP7_DAUCS|nr:hypothetical protein DCAR_0313776 [Daucus carota subsp. sativus]